MYTSIIILIVLAAILMCLIVLIQESKGGGLAADYSNNNQILGAPKTTNFIEKATWVLAGTMIVLSVLSVACLPSAYTDEIEDAEATQVENYENPASNAAEQPAAETPAAEAPASAE